MGLLYLPTFQQIFFKTPEFDINVASSGRLFIWEHNINHFLESSFDRKLVGNGLGVVSSRVIGASHEIWSSHNDYLHVLMALGSIGLVLNLLLYLVFLIDIYISNIDKRIKFFYYGIILAVIAMNFGSGVTLYQVPISQQFWMFVGFFYLYRDFSTSYTTSS